MLLAGPAAPCTHAKHVPGGVTAGPAVLGSEIRGFTQRTAELLKYFYACFPVATAADARERLPKLHGAMTKLQGEMETLRRCLPKDDPAMVAEVRH
jgi:hypothetical protein